MDQLLLPYLQAIDESERQRHLDELLLVYSAPIVRQALRRRLGFYVNQLGINPHNHDAEDLYQEIMTKILQTLHDIGFDGYLSIELFNPTYWSQDPHEVARTALTKLKALTAQVK